MLPNWALIRNTVLAIHTNREIKSYEQENEILLWIDFMGKDLDL